MDAVAHALPQDLSFAEEQLLKMLSETHVQPEDREEIDLEPWKDVEPERLEDYHKGRFEMGSEGVDYLSLIQKKIAAAPEIEAALSSDLKTIALPAMRNTMVTSDHRLEDLVSVFENVPKHLLKQLFGKQEPTPYTLAKYVIYHLARSGQSKMQPGDSMTSCSKTRIIWPSRVRALRNATPVLRRCPPSSTRSLVSGKAS